MFEFADLVNMKFLFILVRHLTKLVQEMFELSAVGTLNQSCGWLLEKLSGSEVTCSMLT